jgi:hypothetical protein
MPLGGFRLNGLGKQLVAPVPEIYVAATATSTTQNVVAPSTVVAGDALVAFVISNRSYGDFPNGWTLHRGDFDFGMRAEITRKLATSGDANTTFNFEIGDATYMEIILLVVRRNVASTSMSLASISKASGEGAVSGTVFPGAPRINFARYASTGAIATRTSANSNFTEYSSSTKHYVRAFPYFTGADTSNFAVSMSDGGTSNIIQGGQISLS